MHVGFIGLGDQGGAMADRIVDAGLPLAVWTRRPQASEPFVRKGAVRCGSAALLASACNILCVCVTGDEDVRSVLMDQGAIDSSPEGAVIAIHSTIRPDTCRMLAETARKMGKHVVDAPVSGSSHAARTGDLTTFTGGDADAIGVLTPVLQSHSGTIIHCGAPGDAMTAKLAHNLIGAANIGLAARAIRTGADAGLPRAVFHDILRAGTARSNALDILKRLEGSPRALHIRSILEKDIALAMEALAPEATGFWGPLAQAGLDALQAVVPNHAEQISQDKPHGASS